MRIGIHVRGFDSGKPVAVDRARERGAETIQIFASNPRQWRLPETRPDADGQLRALLKQHDVAPLFLHAPYLVNLASPSPATAEASERTVAWTLRRAAALGAAGVVVHAGHTAGSTRSEALLRAAAAICRLIDAAPPGPRLLVELTAGTRGSIAGRLGEACELIDACSGARRLGICLDTCHLHAAGYDLGRFDGWEALASDLERTGWDRIGLVHTNDSRDPAGSHRDRHWHIADGSIGEKGFTYLFQIPELSDVPLICETPGKLEEDRRNVALLKRLREQQRAEPEEVPPARPDWVGIG